MNEACFLIINPHCHQGQGWRRWLSIKEEVLRRLPTDSKCLVLEPGARLEDLLLPLLQEDRPNLLISAGGDGGVHFLVNTLMHSCPAPIDNIVLGAIGLGSSNDFLKPFENRINKIPVRINYQGEVCWHDLGLLTYLDKAGNTQNQYFVINASFGVTAEANWNFNNPDRILQYLKSHFTDLAILYTAVKTILTYRNTTCQLQYNELEQQVAVSNINVLKIPYVSGSLRYSQDILPDDGQLGLNLCLNMTKLELLQILNQLGQGRFNLGQKTISTYTRSFQISADAPLVFECDGETAQSTHIEIGVLSRAIQIIKN